MRANRHLRWQGFTALGSGCYELNQGHSIAVTDDYFMGALGRG